MAILFPDVIAQSSIQFPRSICARQLVLEKLKKVYVHALIIERGRSRALLLSQRELHPAAPFTIRHMDFLEKLALVSSSDRGWLEDARQEFNRQRGIVHFRERLRLDQAWIRALWQMALSPYSDAPPPSPQDYHFALFPMMGTGGEKLMRLHRQSHLVSVPWLEECFLERIRIDHWRFLLEEDWSIRDIDQLVADYSGGSVQRQLVSVFACDYRIEQQKDFSGRVSLERSLEHTDAFPNVLDRLSGSFRGREEALLYIAESVLPAWRRGDWKYFSLWFSGTAKHFCSSYDRGEIIHISDALLLSLAERSPYSQE